jgi:uncharacterized membrane protein
MGQKSNILTIKKRITQELSSTSNIKLFLLSFQFFKILNQLLLKKNFILTEKRLSFSNSQIFLTFEVFARTLKLLKYKKKRKNSTNSISKLNVHGKCFNLLSFVKTQFKSFDYTSIIWQVKVINRFVDKKQLIFLHSKLSHFLRIFFTRRFFFFFDFLKITCLYSSDRISSDTYLFFLAQIFKYLHKKRHTRFLAFVKVLFSLLVFDIPSQFPSSSFIKGFKFVYSGKIGGKSRSKTGCVLVGNVPTQSISKTVNFSKAHVNTIYGVFGFKLWVYRS